MLSGEACLFVYTNLSFIQNFPGKIEEKNADTGSVMTANSHGPFDVSVCLILLIDASYRI